jgi:pimeloyl-ACP methyl ester carboxylesterase
MRNGFSFVCKGARIHYQRSGDGPPLLFLKSEDSLPGSDRFIDALTQEFDVIVPDHPGFGASDTPDWLKGIGDAAYFYLDFFNRLDLTQMHIVGSSLGGWLAAEIAVRNTDRIASITLISPLGVRRKGVPFGDIFMWTPEENLRNRLFDQKTAECLVALARNHSKDEATAYLKDRYAAARLCWHPRFHNPELQRWLHRIDRPLQLIWGDADRIVPPEISAVWRDALPQAQLVMIEQCGHLPHIEHPTTVADKVRLFIKGVGS